MKKYLEQRVEELESEVKLLRAKIKLNETKDTSKYINNYPKYNPLKSVYNPNKDYMHNSSVNLMSTPDLETAYASPFDKLNFEKSSLVSITTPTNSDTQPYHISTDLSSLPSVDSGFPSYPDMWGSWDEKNSEDVISETPQTTIPSWGFVSEFDKMDKDFLEWLKSNEAKNAYEISKNITDKYGKNNYRPFKAK